MAEPRFTALYAFLEREEEEARRLVAAREREREELMARAAASERARSAAAASPSWSLVELLGVGHVPQLEAPRECAAAITEWLGSDGKSAAEAASPLEQLWLAR